MPGVVYGQPVERGIHVQDIRHSQGSCRLFKLRRVSFHGLPFSGMVDQDAAHHLRGNRNEMSSAVPIHLLKRRHPQLELVHQGGSLQGVAGRLGAEIVGRQAPEVVVNHASVDPALRPSRPSSSGAKT